MRATHFLLFFASAPTSTSSCRGEMKQGSANLRYFLQLVFDLFSLYDN